MSSALYENDRKLTELLYYTINCINDFAYFGIKVVEPLLFVTLLSYIGISSSYSVFCTIALIASEMLFQSALEGWSGIFADKYGRMLAVNRSLLLRVISCVILLISCIVIFNTTAMPAYALFGLLLCVQFCNAIAEALLSGSIDAWVTDSLSYLKVEPDKIDLVFPKSLTRQNISILISMPFFLFVYYIDSGDGNHIGIYLCTIIACGIFALGFLLTLALRDEVYAKTKEWQDAREASFASKNTSSKKYWSKNIAFAFIFAAPWTVWAATSWFWPMIISEFTNTSTNGSNISDKLLAPLTLLGLALGAVRVFGTYSSQLFYRYVNLETGLRLSLRLNSFGCLAIGVLLFLKGVDVITRSLFWTIIVMSLLVLTLFGQELLKVLIKIKLKNMITEPTERAAQISWSSKIASIYAFSVVVVAGLFGLLFSKMELTNDAIIISIVLIGSFTATKLLFHYGLYCLERSNANDIERNSSQEDSKATEVTEA